MNFTKAIFRPNWFPERSANFYSALSRNNGLPRGVAFHRPKWFCKQRKWFYLERLSRLGARFHDFVGVDCFARRYISFFRRNWSPRTAILIMKFQFRYWNLGRKKKTAAKDKRRNGNNRHTKQSKRQNVNSSEATFTRNSNENAKMQANHSRNQNKKAAEVLTKKGLESKLRPMCQTSSSNKPWKIWKPIESEWLIEEILELSLELASSVAKDANKTRQVDLTFDGCCGPRVSKHCRNLSHSRTKENRF